MEKEGGEKQNKKKKSQAPPVSQPQPLPTLSHTGEDEAAGSSDQKEYSSTYPWAVIPESTVIGEPLIWNLKSFEFLVVSRFGLDHHGDPYRHTASLGLVLRGGHTTAYLRHMNTEMAVLVFLDYPRCLI